MTTYGGSIYGDGAGPIAPRSWGVTTQRGDTVFVHVLDWSDPGAGAAGAAGRWKARLWASGAPVGSQDRASQSGVVRNPIA